MWQKCPVCGGTGKVPNNLSSIHDTCDVCHGKKIISQLTGLPPNGFQDFTKKPEYAPPFNGTDFRDQGYETQQEYFGK
jgi:RecJ-like exonuclease